MSKETDMLKYFDDGTLIMGKCGQVWRTVTAKGRNPGRKLNTPVRISTRYKNDYFRFCFKQNHLLCHRMQMVCTTREGIPEGMEVMQLNENKVCNYSWNLKIGTRSENANFPEILKKSRERRLGKTMSAETCKKISAASAGVNNPMYGKKHSPKMLAYLKERARGRKSPMEGKKHSPETIAKMSATHTRYYELKRSEAKK